MPVGGIGTGDISIGGNGQWKDVEIMNKPGIGFYGAPTPKETPCFMIFVQERVTLHEGETKEFSVPGE
jgi:uncharacterized protein (DUF608 family)